jgi:hypothetical protein
MVELINGSGVYVFEKTISQAFKVGTEHQTGTYSGEKMARYLLNVFWSRKELTFDLKVLIYIYITNITVCPIRLAAILMIMSVLAFKTTVILLQIIWTHKIDAFIHFLKFK